MQVLFPFTMNARGPIRILWALLCVGVVNAALFYVYTYAILSAYKAVRP